MNSIDEVYKSFITTLGIDEISESKSTCSYSNDDLLSENQKGKIVSGCFYSKIESTELAQLIVKNASNSQFILLRGPRQDYLKWTFSYTANENAFEVTVGVDDIVSSRTLNPVIKSKSDSGLRSLVNINVFDKRN